VHWVKAALTPSEVARVRYLDYAYWNELSRGGPGSPSTPRHGYGLTAYALAGFPRDVECLIGTSPSMHRWTH
jgi:hypothetical protein